MKTRFPPMISVGFVLSVLPFIVAYVSARINIDGSNAVCETCLQPLDAWKVEGHYASIAFAVIFLLAGIAYLGRSFCKKN
jgi:hypothetical protein